MYTHTHPERRHVCMHPYRISVVRILMYIYVYIYIYIYIYIDLLPVADLILT